MIAMKIRVRKRYRASLILHVISFKKLLFHIHKPPQVEYDSQAIMLMIVSEFHQAVLFLIS